MARYEEVKTSIWDEPDMEKWPPHAKLLYVYLLTSPLSHGITGIYPVTERKIRGHTNLKASQVQRGFVLIGPRVRRYPGCWIWVVSRFKHACNSPNHFRAACKHLRDEIPPQIRADFVAHYTSSELVRTYVNRRDPKSKDLGVLWKGLAGLCQGITPSPIPDPTPTPVPRPSLAEPHTEGVRPGSMGAEIARQIAEQQAEHGAG